MTRLTRRRGRWRATGDDAGLATDFEQFVASVQRTLDREGPAMMANKDDEAIAMELASAWDELGLTLDDDVDDVARARPASPTATTQPTLAADVTPHAVPYENEARAEQNPVATTPSIIAPASPAVPPDSARSGGSKGWWHRSLEWLRSPGMLVTVGAAAIASIVTWQVVKPSVPGGELPFGFGGSAVVGDTGQLRCPPGTQPRSEVLDRGRRAIWCERPSPDGPVRAPWIELDASGSPRSIGRYVGDKREGAFLSIDVDEGVVRTQTMCFFGGKRVAPSACDVP